MSDIFIFDQWNRALWLFAVYTLLTIGLLYIARCKVREKKSEKFITLGFVFIFFGVGLSRFVIFLGDFFIEGYYGIAHTYYGSYPNDFGIFSLLNKIGYVIWFIFIILFYLSFEKALSSKYYPMTLLNGGFLILLIINSDLFLIFAAFDIIITFYYLIRYFNTISPEIQTDSSFVLIGVILFWLGFFLEIFAVRELYIMSPNFLAFFFIIGALIQVSNRIIRQILITNSVLILISILISLIYLSFPLILFIIYLGAIILFGGLTLYSISRVVLVLKSEDLIDENDKASEKDEALEVLKLMTKGNKDKLTEEEISLYKEKKVCLVCKNKIAGFLFVCPHCDVLYCQKCASYLVKADNLCWVCEERLDKSKPVNKHRKKKEKSEATKITEEKEKSLKKKVP